MTEEVFLPAVVTNTGPTIANLCAAYKSDPYSRYHKGRYVTRQNADALMRRLVMEHGSVRLADLGPREIVDMHTRWLGPDGKKVAMAHALISMLRTCVGYGAVFLRSAECRELRELLRMRFDMSKPRSTTLTPEQVIAIRRKAHEMGLPSIALAQATQFSLGFRQKDIIGERVPSTEKVKPVFVHDGLYWLRGIHWGEIDDDLILRHVTSKKLKPVEMNLKLAPMFMSEMKHLGPIEAQTGPLIISEETGVPYSAVQFRRVWRTVADAAGIPKHIKNMDTRASKITFALQQGASLQSVRKMATHSTEAQTQNYSRGDTQEIANVMTICAAAEQEMEAAA